MSVTKPSAGSAAVKDRHFGDCIDQTRRALHICDLLEALADDLPKRRAPHWREARLQCRSVLLPYFRWMQDLILPELERKSDQNVDRTDVLARLATDYRDQLHSLTDLEDLIADAILCEKFAEEPEALGYALRGHFDSLRRDLSWQLAVLWPLATRLCTDADAARFLEALHSKRASS